MDYIHITELRYNGKHGVYDAERAKEQEFLISIRLGVDVSVAGKSDKLSDTIDYQRVKDSIAEVIAGESRYLVERLGQEILERVFEDARIRSGEVTIQKTAVWENGVPGVTIVRNNPN